MAYPLITPKRCVSALTHSPHLVFVILSTSLALILGLATVRTPSKCCSQAHRLGACTHFHSESLTQCLPTDSVQRQYHGRNLFGHSGACRGVRVGNASLDSQGHLHDYSKPTNPLFLSYNPPFSLILRFIVVPCLHARQNGTLNRHQ